MKTLFSAALARRAANKTPTGDSAMATYEVHVVRTITMTVDIGVEADSKAQAEELARRMMDNTTCMTTTETTATARHPYDD